MSDILDFIHARLADDERLALAASPGPWHPNDEHTEVLAVDDIVVADGFALSNRQLSATVDHIIDNDPPSVLRRGELVRAMLAHAEAAGQFEREVKVRHGGWTNEELDQDPIPVVDVRMHRDIAAYWNWHPDYRPEWAPAGDES